MTTSPRTGLTIALPIEDRRRSFAFYRDGLGFRAVGEPAEDGVPEPLRFAVNDGLTLMLVPTGGFGWVLGGREVAGSGVSECVLGLDAASPAEVDALLARAEAAGATVVTAPIRQPWGYSGTFTDPDGHLWMVEAAPED
ncbi:VOC family protein [Streptomyces spiramenti]|uniref:VOC family protein n=1 Tax=Streptomyces spiramenti TaxID=2720606 RepID=UPI0030845C21